MARRQRQRQRQSGVKANAKFYVFLGVIAAAVVAVVYFVTSINTVTVEQGEIRFEAEAPVVLVRDEQLIAEDSYARANLIVREGERVEADAQVADVYKFSYNDKVMDELTEKQNVIEQYQIKALESANDAKLAEIDDGIARKSAEIKDIINNRSGNLLTAERELKDLMTEKRAYLKEAVQSDQMLEQYYGEEAQLQDRVDGW